MKRLSTTKNRISLHKNAITHEINSLKGSMGIRKAIIGVNSTVQPPILEILPVSMVKGADKLTVIKVWRKIKGLPALGYKPFTRFKLLVLKCLIFDNILK